MLLIEGMRGLGDCIYQRAYLHEIGEAYLETPWPQLYADLPLRCVRPDTTLRTQKTNIERQDTASCWWEPRDITRTITIRYGMADLARGSIPDAMRSLFGTRPRWDLPALPRSLITATKPIAVVRPVTIRREWRNQSRAPMPEYVAQAALTLRARGYYVVSVADLKDGEEWLLPPAPVADLQLHRGELEPLALLSLIRSAAVVVGGVGWIVPACISAGTPLYVVLGGNGAHNGIEQLTDPSMNLSRIGWVTPDRFCRCLRMNHDCDKYISNFERGLESWLAALAA